MVEQEPNTSETQAGQPETVPSPEQGVAVESGQVKESVESQSLTREQILELVKSAIGEAEPEIISKATRHAQSLTDKATERLNARIEELKRAGVEVSNEQRYNLEKIISEEVLKEESASPKAEAKQQGAEDLSAKTGNPIVDMTRARQAKLIEKYGVAIEEGDQEFNLVPWNAPDPFTFLEEYEAQLKAKLDRIKSVPEVENSETDESDLMLSDSRQSRVPEDTSGMSSLDLISRGYKDLYKQRTRR